MLMRWARKIVVIALAAFGAQRLFELARPHVDRVKEQATPHLHDAVVRIRGTVDEVAGDVTDAGQILKDGAQDVSADLTDAAEAVKSEVQAATQDIKKVVEPTPAPGAAATHERAVAET